MAQQTLTFSMENTLFPNEQVLYTDLVSVNSVFFEDGVSRNIIRLLMEDSGQVTIHVDGGNYDLTSAFESSGEMLFTASNGSTLTLIGISDPSEPYMWFPSNSAEVISFVNTLIGLSNKTITLRLDDSPGPTAVPDIPNIALSSITSTSVVVFLAFGEPGELCQYRIRETGTFIWTTGPSETSFTQTITGLSPGTEYDVQGQCSNEVGASGWSASSTFTTLMGLQAPVFSFTSGSFQDWTVGQSITPITAPEAIGNPDPTYAVEGSLPSGINFSTSTRVISGTPSSAGSGSITIRAMNSEGHGDWSFNYTIATAGAPDLTVGTPTRNPSGNLTPGQQFTLSTTVRNGGNANSASTTLRWRSSSNNSITTGDPSVGTDPVNGLSVGGTSSESITLNAPNTPGTYYYGATVDAVSGESDTGNNNSGSVSLIVESAATPPDLTVDTPTTIPSGPFEPGASFTLATTVRNIGETASASTTLRWRSSSNNQISTSDTQIGTDGVSTIAGGGAGQESISLTAPNAEGTYYYGATVDAVSGEGDTGNNASGAVAVVVQVLVVTAPDLVVDTPTVNPSGTLSTGDSFTLTTTVRNQGDANAPSTTLRWRSSSNSTINTNDTQVGTDFVPSLSAGGSGQESIPLTAPSTPGTYYYGATVDTVSGESDTGNNNSGARSIVVVAAVFPDLTVDTPTVSPTGTLEPGESFTLSTVVRNSGDGNSPSTTLRWRQSNNVTITESDSSVGTDPVSALSSGGSSNESISLNAPNSPGIYYYGATVDSVSGESDTGNNNSNAVTVTVQAVAATFPDLTIDTPTRIPSGDLMPGQAFTLTAVVRNIGDANSEVTTLRWRISVDSNITESDLESSTDSVPALVPNATSTETSNFIASNTPGTIYYGATVDADSDESDVTNNASVGIAVVTVEATTGPNFADDTGDAQSWVVGTAISPITVPTATGTPTPTYEAVGPPPTGISFNPNTRVISGTPTTIGSGTIIIRAMNSEGSDNWTVGYTTTATPLANIDPIADAGNNQSVAAGASVSLDGTGSSDSDGNVVSYAWTQTAGDTVVLTGVNTSTPSFTAPSTDTAQTLTFRLTVTDDDGATDTDDVNINVAATVAPPMPGMETRLDTIAALDSLFTRFNTGPDQGAWVVDPTGTTTSSGTGPGTNSEGPYVFSESSGSDDNLPNISTLTALDSVMAGWTGSGRMLLLRACIQGSGSYPNDSASGLQIQGRVSSSDPWTLIDLLEGWAYDTNYVVGNTVTDSLGVTQTIVQDGGWVDFAVPIPDNYTQLRIRNLPAMGASAFTHDAALWNAEFRNGSGIPDRPPVVSITTPTGMMIASEGELDLTATASDPDNQTLSYLWEAFEINDFLFGSPPTNIGGFSDNSILNPVWTTPSVASITTYTLRLTVTDTDGLTASDTTSVQVLPATVNTDPLASAGSDQNVAAWVYWLP